MPSTVLAPVIVRRSGALVETMLWVTGVLLLAGSAQVAVTLPFTVVPLTGQTFAALLIGAAYGSTRGSITFAGYLLIGFLGAPVFTAHGGGLDYLSVPSAGYLFGMLVAVALVGWAGERGWDRKVGTAVATMVAGNVVIYGFGLVWLGFALGTDPARTFALGAAPFLIGDLVKVLLAAGLLPGAWALMDRLR